MKNLIIRPTTLSIITTYQCTSACKDCCFQSTPLRKEKLTINEIRQYITESVEAYHTIKVLVLTGGECFLYGNKLDEIIKHANSLGLVVRVVTNGFWAKSYDKAKDRIESLIKVGLNEINFSTGDDHLQYVPIRNIKNGVIASLESGITTVVNVESNEVKQFNSKHFIEDESLSKYIDKGQLKIINGLWMPFTEATFNEIEDARKIRKIHFSDSHTRCTNLFNTITIDPNHRMIACCGLTSKYIKYLDLGNVKKNSIKELYERQFEDFLKIWVATEGPHKIMDFISQFLDIEIEYKSLHSCQVCAMIFNNDNILRIINDKYKDVYTNIILNHIFYKNQFSYENAE